MPDFAPGIPDREQYGEPTRHLTPGELVSYFVQRHRTLRRPDSEHLDLRLGTPETDLFSWAIPKGRMPEGKERLLAPQTQLHRYGYGDFQGDITRGYGAGQVRRADKGKVVITRVTPNTIQFTLAHTRIPTRYALIRMQTERGREWLLVHKPIPKDVPGVGDKPSFQRIEATDLQEALEQASEVQEKIDGAHGVYQLDKGRLEAYSVRPRTTGEPIVHTERLGLEGVQVPDDVQDTVLRGEIYAKDPSGKAIPFQDLSGLLNMTIERARETQKQLQLTPQHAIFDVLRHQGKDVSGLPREARRKIVRQVLERLPGEQFHEPNTATTASEKAVLATDIEQRRNPRTQEGLILRMPDGRTLKFKHRREATAYPTGTYPGKGQRMSTIGGLTFSLEPGGAPAGQVGSGFTQEELGRISRKLRDYIGRPMRVEHQGQFASGKLRAPTFKGWETDKGAAAAHESWIGVDLDGTLAKYDGFEGADKIGDPIPRMVRRVKNWLKQGQPVKIMTARVADDPKGVARKAIKAWCKEHIGQVLPITNVKDHGMIALWDDRATKVQKNTGKKLAAARQTFQQALDASGVPGDVYFYTDGKRCTACFGDWHDNEDWDRGRALAKRYFDWEEPDDSEIGKPAWATKQYHSTNAHKEASDRPGGFSYSSTQIQLSPVLVMLMRELQKTIADEDLYTEGDSFGKEKDCHITCLYGLHTDDAAPVKKNLAGVGPITAKFGDLSLFETDKYDVLKFDIESEDLHAANKQLRKLDHTNTHPEYKPHATVAYIKAGKGKKYLKASKLTGRSFTADAVVFSSTDDSRTTIPLREQEKQAAGLIPLIVTDAEGAKKAELAVELADTPEARIRGLGYRDSLPAGQGMLFDKVGGYWMKGMRFPIDIVFLTKEGRLLEHHHMPLEPRRRIVFPESKEAAHALELPAGWCAEQGVQPGDMVKVAARLPVRGTRRLMGKLLDRVFRTVAAQRCFKCV
jgi:uncharacterized membrane protein (UPF0127 family)/2'-5' RNA ligase